MSDVEKQLAIIFSNEKRKGSIKYRVKKEFLGHKDTIYKAPTGITADSLHTGDIRLESENVDLIRALFIRAINRDKEAIIKELKSLLRPDHIQDKLGGFAFIAISKIHSVNLAVASLCPIEFTSDNYANTLAILADVLRFEYNLFPNESLLELQEYLSSAKRRYEIIRHRINYSLAAPGKILRLLPVIEALINNIQHSRLAKELLENINWEINQDLEAVKIEINKYGLEPGLAEVLEKLDDAIIQGKDKFDFKQCIELSRTFQEHLIQQIVSKIQHKTSITYKGAPRIFTQWLEYLKRSDIAFLSDKEYQLGKSMYDFASETGTHSLGSKIEAARIIKNILIEYALYLLKKLEVYL